MNNILPIVLLLVIIIMSNLLIVILLFIRINKHKKIILGLYKNIDSNSVSETSLKNNIQKTNEQE